MEQGAQGEMELGEPCPLESRFAQACERLGVLPHQEIASGIHEVATGQRDVPATMSLSGIEMSDADATALAEILPELSNLTALDLSGNSLGARGGLELMRGLRQVGDKASLAYVDLSCSNTLGREAQRDLFRQGLNMQVLDLSYCQLRKVDPLANFKSMTTLILDYNPLLTSLPVGALAGAPSIQRLSLCGSGVSNLWTSTAELSQLPNLVELRFQRLDLPRGGQGTDPTWSPSPSSSPAPVPETSARPEAEGAGARVETMWSRAGGANRLRGSPGGLGWLARGLEPPTDTDTDRDLEDESQGGDATFAHGRWEEQYAGYEGEDLEIYNIDLGAEFNMEEAGGRGGTPAVAGGAGGAPGEDGGDMMVDMEEEGGYDEEGEEEGHVTPRGERLPGPGPPLLHAGAAVGAGAGAADAPFGGVAGGAEWAHGPPSGLVLLDGHAGAAPHPLGDAAAAARAAEGDGALPEGAEGLEVRGSAIPAPNVHTSPICHHRAYREFMLVKLPNLACLDGVAVGPDERWCARAAYEAAFEPRANGSVQGANMLRALQGREIGRASAPRVKVSPQAAQHGGAERSGSAWSSLTFRHAACTAQQSTTVWPESQPLCPARYRPRQFEYHPTEPQYMVFGTLHGEVVVLNHETDEVLGQVQSIGAPHSILGLCWLHNDPGKLIAGSDNGSIQLYDVNHMKASVITQRHGTSTSAGMHRNRSPAIYTYDDFEQLTSVHINCSDDVFLASGYSNHVGLYDLRTGKRLQIFKDLHREHINVLKFAHHSPHLFATSSFDHDIKMWDIRQRTDKPLYTARSSRGNVMVCFSPDDKFLLSSAVDNEVRQHLASDGRLHTQFDLPSTGSAHNYTRSYYLNGRDYIITGSCEENVVRVCCANTGRRLRDVTLEGRALDGSIYVQSLRGDPFYDFRFSVLVAYNHASSRSEIVKVDLLSEDREEGRKASPMRQMPMAGMGG